MICGRGFILLFFLFLIVVARGHRSSCSSSRQCNEDKTLGNHNLLIKLGLRTLLHFQQITCVSANKFPLPLLAWLLGRVSFIAASGRYVRTSAKSCASVALQLRIWIIPCCSGQIVITTYNKSLGLVIVDRQLRSDQLNRFLLRHPLLVCGTQYYWGWSVHY